jgi:hypothetical protein
MRKHLQKHLGKGKLHPNENKQRRAYAKLIARFTEVKRKKFLGRGYRGYCNNGQMTEQELDWKQIFKLARKEAENKKSKYLEGKPRSNIFSNVINDDIVQDTMEEIIRRNTKGEKNARRECYIAITIILQKGGTSKRMSGSQEAVYGDQSITLSSIREACKNNKITVRQLARTLREQIIDVMKTLDDPDLEGNLARKFARAHPDATQEEKYWASDFQTDNPECPDRVREWLIADYTERFERK